MGGKAKPSPSKYAPIIPALRNLKAKLVTLDRIREVVAQPSVGEAIALLKDTIYGEALSIEDLSKIQKNLIIHYVKILDKIRKITPVEAVPLIDAFRREVEAGDLVILAAISSQSRPLPETVTGEIEDTIAYKIKREPESLSSTARFLESLEGTWASKYSNILKKVAEAGSQAITSWARLLIVASEYSKALESLEPRVSGATAAKVLCPLLNWMIASALIQAKRTGVESKSLEDVLTDVKDCRFRVATAKMVYEREAGVDGMVASINEIVKGVKIDPSKEIVEALEEARVEARKEAVRRANVIFSGYPFHAGIIAAGLVLLKLNVEDMITILHGIALRLPSEDYLPLTVLT